MPLTVRGWPARNRAPSGTEVMKDRTLNRPIGRVAAGLVPIRGPQDFYGGLVLVLVAILALVASADLPGQRGFAFGPGT